MLDVLEDERVLPRVQAAGEALRAGIRDVASRHEAIGDVRGMGLAIGVEIVSDRASKAPDADATAAIKEGMRDRGVLVGTTGTAGNILKVRPPLAFTTAEVPVFTRRPRGSCPGLRLDSADAVRSPFASSTRCRTRRRVRSSAGSPRPGPTLAERHRRGFEDAGAEDVAIVAGSADGGRSGLGFADSWRRDAGGIGGLVVLGLRFRSRWRPSPIDAPSSTAAGVRGRRGALANNRYSADVVAIARIDRSPDIPDLPGDNALPRWLSEVAGYEVDDLQRRWRLAVDIDGPLDLVLTGGRDAPRRRSRPSPLRRAGSPRSGRSPRIRGAELLIAGRTSSGDPRLARTPHRLADPRAHRGARPASRRDGPNRRPPASVLGALLDRDGPESFGDHLARLADAAIVDTRVLLAHRLGRR